MEIESVDTHLFCVNVGNFLNTWVYSSNDLCFLVDPGPSVSINSLKKALKRLKIGKNDLDYILLTHPHIDHAGGVGNLLNFFPQSIMICHPKGIKHLINPKKLWEGSLKVLGNAAQFYGKIEPVPEDRIQYQENFGNGEIKTIETLGHSPHHQSYLFKNFLFVGEACGHNYPSDDVIYIRPATPPIFDYNIYLASIEKLIKLDLSNYKICFPHFGMRDNAALIIKIAKSQIITWMRVVDLLYNERKQPNFMNHLIAELKSHDNIFANLNLLSQERQTREPFILRQSIDGIIGYIEKNRKA